MDSTRRSFLAGGLALAGPPPQEARPAARIGVVNLRSCFDRDKYARMAEIAQQLGSMREGFLKEADELQQKINGLANQMPGIPKNSDLYAEKVRLRAHAEYDLKLLQEVARRKLRDLAADAESRVDAEIRRVVADVAREKGVELVFRVEAPRFQEDDAEASALQRIVGREVLFYQASLDLTAALIARLNANWAKAWVCPTCRRKVTDAKCPDCPSK